MPLTLFGVQLVLNVAWSWIFFGMHHTQKDLDDGFSVTGGFTTDTELDTEAEEGEA